MIELLTAPFEGISAATLALVGVIILFAGFLRGFVGFGAVFCSEESPLEPELRPKRLTRHPPLRRRRLPQPSAPIDVELPVGSRCRTAC